MASLTIVMPVDNERDTLRLARDRLQALGVGAVSGGEWCTASDPERFFSHRRDAPRTGRMAALVWLGDVRM